MKSSRTSQKASSYCTMVSGGSRHWPLLLCVSGTVTTVEAQLSRQCSRPSLVNGSKEWSRSFRRWCTELICERFLVVDARRDRLSFRKARRGSYRSKAAKLFFKAHDVVVVVGAGL